MILKTKNNPGSGVINFAFFSFIAAIICITILPIYSQYMPPLMIIWSLFWLAEFILRKHRLEEDRKAQLILFGSFVVMFIWISIGILYSQEKQIGILLTFRKLSLLIFPLVLFSPGFEIKDRVQTLLKAFVIGVITYLIFCFCYALFRSISVENGILLFNSKKPDEPWLNYFYGEQLTIGHHISYIAMYSLLAMFISLEFFFNNAVKLIKRVIWLSLAGFLIVSIYFISSRAAFLAILVTLPVYLILKLGKKRLNIVTISSILFIVVCLSSIYYLNQKVQNLFDNSTDPSIKKDERFGIWNSAIVVSLRNPVIGVGIGDSFNELEKEFKNLGYSKGFYKNLNAHNQYLEILLCSGIVGLLIFLSIIGIMLHDAIRNKNVLYGVFIIMILIFFIFESMLERLAGVTFFSLFSFLLMHFKNHVSEQRKVEQN
jgi:O-antigen ligase